ncbi:MULTISPECIES: hypothetical protein [Streptacidiphilus]|uniref:Uncharacterized protein n=2 Tax=Streptacidiphilus TaxID=228398 RepID=A0ABV6UW15_9ACTN|nr:hypothetical protein [Streptacidiphilus jeojiense]
MLDQVTLWVLGIAGILAAALTAGKLLIDQAGELLRAWKRLMAAWRQEE